MRKSLLFVLLLLWAGSSWGQVNLYSFASSSGSYTEITGGTVLGNASSDDQRFVDPAVPLGGTTSTGPGFPIGFNFTFDGIIFDRFAVNNNGWISLGQSALSPAAVNMPSATTPISSTSAVTPAQLVSRMAGVGRDLQGQTGSELRIETIGSAPDRECVIQWKVYKKYGTSGTGDNYNFQIRLVETTNQIKLVYGVMTNNATSTTIQVGLRVAPASPASNFANRATLTDWANTTPGATATAACTLSNSVYPASGLTFVYSPPPPCTGTPAPGNTVTSTNPVCPGVTFTLSLQNFTPGTGVTYQWESSPDGSAPWTNIGTNPTVTISQTAATWYHCLVTCSGNTSTSNPVQVTMNPFFYNCYCTSMASNAADEEIYSVSVGGNTNAYDCFTVAPGPGSILKRYSNFISLGSKFNLAQTASVPFTILEDECDGATYYTNACSIWVDFNHDGDFTDAGEQVYLESVLTQSPRTISGNIYVPAGATLGLTGMRITVCETYYGATLTPCLAYSYGETEDYLVTITEPPPCASPSALTTTNITTTTALLDWTNGGTETSWDVIYGPPGFDPLTQGTLISGINSHPYYLNPPLTSGTLYSWYVRANCTGPFPLSTWSAPANFQTICTDNTAYPFTESFDNAWFPPVCWDTSLMVIGGGSGTLYGNWVRVLNGTTPTCTTHSGTGMAKFNSYSFKAGTKSILVSPALYLPGENYMVKFWMYRDNGYPTLYDQVNVYYNTSPTSSGATLIGTVNRCYLFPPAELIANAWYYYEFGLPAGSGGGGGRYVIFEGVSEYGNNIFVDDVEIAPPSSLSGHVYDFYGNPVAGATVARVGGISYTTGPDGYYQLLPLSGGPQQFKCSRTGYNDELASINIPLYSEATHDFILLNPEIAVSPASLFAILGPTETESDPLVITNDGNGLLGWAAVISYGGPPLGASFHTNPRQPAPQGEIRNTESAPDAKVSKVGSGQSDGNRDAMLCPDGSFFSQPIDFAAPNINTSELSSGYKVFQHVSGLSNDVVSITTWGASMIYSGSWAICSGEDPVNFLVEFWADGSTPGANIASYTVTASVTFVGNIWDSWPTFQYTLPIPLTTMADGWISIQGLSPTSGINCSFLWVPTLNPYGTALQWTGSAYTTLPYSMSLCLSTTGWLTLDNYDGTVPPAGGTQTISATIDASKTPPAMAPGVTYHAEILFTSPSGINSVTVPVTLIVTDGGLLGPQELTPYIVDEGGGKFMLKWKYFTLRDMQFLHFAILRNGELIGTTPVSAYEFTLTEPGTYCYKVYAVYEGGVYSDPSNEVCITFPLPPGVPLSNWALLVGGLLIGAYAFYMIWKRS